MSNHINYLISLQTIRINAITKQIVEVESAEETKSLSRFIVNRLTATPYTKAEKLTNLQDKLHKVECKIAKLKTIKALDKEIINLNRFNKILNLSQVFPFERPSQKQRYYSNLETDYVSLEKGEILICGQLYPPKSSVGDIIITLKDLRDSYMLEIKQDLKHF